MNINIHHHHHVCEEDRGLLIVQNEMLATMLEKIKMLTQEVQNLIAQSQAADDVLSALDLRFKALVGQVSDLQGQVAALRVGSVMTDAEKQSIVTLTGQLAANVSNAQADILANTPAAPVAADPATPADPAADPSKPATPADPAAAPATPATPPASPASGA